jgi:anthranilate 1,2-dioxygenase small subunit
VTEAAVRANDAASLFEIYTRLIDDDQLEEWIELFVENCVYEILTRENVAQSLPLPLVLCDNKNMLYDRILSLRKANIYNIHTDRHILSQVRSEVCADGSVEASASYALYQTNQEGETRLFSVGKYQGKMVSRGNQLLFERLSVIVDTAGILTLLATPI